MLGEVCRLLCIFRVLVFLWRLDSDLVLTAHHQILTWDVTYGLGIFPAADEELMYKTKKYNRNSEGVLMRSDGKPMTQDDHDALAPYGAFVLLGRVRIALCVSIDVGVVVVVVIVCFHHL